MSTEWIMIVITAIYVIATLLICVSNYKSAKLARQSNEISLISQLVNIEERQLTDTKVVIDMFVKATNCCLKGDFSNQANIIFSISESYDLLQRCLRIDRIHSTHEYQKLKNCSSCYYYKSIDL